MVAEKLAGKKAPVTEREAEEAERRKNKAEEAAKRKYEDIKVGLSGLLIDG
jgi:hypothetical protein